MIAKGQERSDAALVLRSNAAARTHDDAGLENMQKRWRQAKSVESAGGAFVAALL